MTWDHFISVCIGVICGVVITRAWMALGLDEKLPPARDVEEAVRRERLDAKFRERQDARERRDRAR